MPDSRSLLQSLFATTTKITSTMTENALELLKYQQDQLQKQLLKQELLNANLYQSLLDSGILSNNNEAAFNAASNQITSTAANILDILKNRGYLNQQATTSSTLNNLSSFTSNLQSFLPLGDMFSGFSSIFEKMFGTKFWLYALVAILTGTFFTCIACFCMYCLCCSNFGRTLMCCLKCGWFSWFKRANGNSSKKKESKDNTGKLKCCI